MPHLYTVPHTLLPNERLLLTYTGSAACCHANLSHAIQRQTVCLTSQRWVLHEQVLYPSLAGKLP